MTDIDDVSERQRRRDEYLVAFYELTKDQQLRWATHHDIGEKAGLSDNEAMSIGSLLAERHLVEFQTMGGPAGSVELTSRGVDEAERIVQQLSKTNRDEVLAAKDSDPDADRQWVEKYMPMVTMAFRVFRQDASWPELESLQRALDRETLDIDVREAMITLPRIPGEMRTTYPTHFHLPLRILEFLPEADDVVGACLDLIRAAVEKYYSANSTGQCNGPAMMAGSTRTLNRWRYQHGLFSPLWGRT